MPTLLSNQQTNTKQHTEDTTKHTFDGLLIILCSPLIKTPITTLSAGCSWCEVRSLPPFLLPEEAFSHTRLSTLSSSGDPGLGAP